MTVVALTNNIELGGTCIRVVMSAGCKKPAYMKVVGLPVGKASLHVGSLRLRASPSIVAVTTAGRRSRTARPTRSQATVFGKPHEIPM